MHSLSKQKGSFTVELAAIAVLFSILIIFTGDMVIKLSTQGQLDRLSYSMVNVVKERTQLYNPDTTAIDEESARELHAIIRGSFSRMMESFDASKLRTTFESLTFPDNAQTLTAIEQGGGCPLSDTLADHENLSMMTSWGRRASLYRVTICYDTDNWASHFLGSEFTTVHSSSIMMGR